MSNLPKGILNDWNSTSEEIRQLMGQAIRNVLIEHRHAGSPVATIQEGRVVMIEPDELPLDATVDSEHTHDQTSN